MAEPSTPLQWRGSFIFSGEGAPNRSLTGFSFLALDVTVATLQVISDAWAEECWALFSSNDLVCDRASWKQGPSETGQTIEVQVGTPGSGSSNASPPQVSFLVEHRIPDISGRFWGRSFVPGVPVNLVGPSGDLNDGNLAQMKLAYDAWQADNEALGFQACVLNGTSDSRLVSEYLIDGQVATQRRRNRR